MRTNTYRMDGYLVIHLDEKLSMLSNIEFFKDIVQDLIAPNELKIGIRFLPSSFLSSHSIVILVACNQILAQAGGELAIFDGGEELQEYLTKLGILDEFNLLKSCEITSAIG
jgi:hypothetical protein